MSQLGSTLNGKMKLQIDDPNVKILRELSNLPSNKYCFDCGQRGPTYVNITIGSFVCMTCSGLLRGLTPPHRVKSISMASFTVEEIDSLKAKGNEYCRKVWLATCTEKDSLPGSEKDPDRVNILRTFMSVKYEQKRFYIDPSKLSEIQLGEIHATGLTSASQHSSTSVQKSPSVSSNRSPSCFQKSNPSPHIRNNIQTQLSHINRLPNSITLPNIKSLTSLLGPNTMLYEGSKATLHHNTTTTPPMNFDNPNPPQPTSRKNCSSDSSPWGDNLNGHNINAVEKYLETNFANFEDAFSQKQLDVNSDLFAIQNQNSRSRIHNNNHDISNSKFNNDDINFSQHGGFMQIPILPYNNDNQNIASNRINQQPYNTNFIDPSSIKTPTRNICNEDKYAALKDLDSLFKQTANQDENTSEGGITASASLPSNLSSCEWFSSGVNPFVQVQAQKPSQGTWNATNPHNPFSGNIKSLETSSGPSHSKYSMNLGQTANTGNKINPFETFTSISNPKNPFL